MKRVTLNGIRRRGLIHWKAREWWCRQRVHIWSAEHHAWWRTAAAGYTDQVDEAGEWDFPAAFDHVKHCGPEKKICFDQATSQ